MTGDLRAALAPLADALEALGTEYRVGGSVASSALGVGRSTLDIDLVADLRLADVDALVVRLGDAYYVDADMIRDAIRRRASFNVIHLATMLKLDVFIVKTRPFDQRAFTRVTRSALDDGDSRAFPLTTAEDIVLHKLEWYRLGDGISGRQWDDVLGVLRVQGDALDRAYLERWARELAVDDLLARAWDEAAGP
jgi:hypothetical protein